MNERQRIAHLMRRAGFGATRDELDRLTALGYEGAVDDLLDGSADGPAPPGDLGTDPKVVDLQRTWLTQMLKTSRPLQEKMTLFWHSLLTSGTPKVQEHDWLWQQNQLFRQQALGNYGDLLTQVGRDPAMLRWLDGAQSRKAHPNENYARELMELFSMGIGNYTEQDVKEAARAFTGWTVDKLTGVADLKPNQHDAGAKTIFGETGKYDDAGVVKLILGQPATANYLAKKLLGFFYADAPADDFVADIATNLRSTGYEVKPALRAIFLSPQFSSEAAYRARVKSPTEYVVGLTRHLGYDAVPDGLAPAMNGMGQSLFAPPNVAGWPGGSRAWISTSMLLSRFNSARGALGKADLSALAGGSPDEARDRLLDHFLDGDGTARLRQVVRDWLASHGTGAAAIKSAAHLVVSSPTYQMA